uniref:Uncharacterized protein n=1 Tax=Oryza punctata TaxID=4537 RepID=A0A0E0JIQ9_ORYPU
MEMEMEIAPRRSAELGHIHKSSKSEVAMIDYSLPQPQPYHLGTGPQSASTTRPGSKADRQKT